MMMEIDSGKIVSSLMKGAGAVYLHEASVILLARHGYWLQRNDFLRFVKVLKNPPDAAGIDWAAVIAAIDSGDLRADEEEIAILKISASIAGHFGLFLYDVVQGISRDNIKYVAEAIMYADGFLESIADPQ
jgi:hypothetical protein